MPSTPTDKTLPVGSEEHQKLTRWRSEFQQDFRAFGVWREKKREWDKFYDGDQISSEEREELKKRNQPEVVINKIKPRIDGVIGDFLGQRVMMRARDRGSADFDVAKHVTEALRYIEDRNRFDESEAKTAEDLLIGGVGWYKIKLEFDFLEPEIIVTHRTSDDIVVDRRARRRDLLDAKRMYETVWVEVEDAIELYPKHESFIRDAAAKENQTLTGDSPLGEQHTYIGDDYKRSENVSPDTNLDLETFVDPERKRVRLINVWERVQKKVEFAFHPDIEGTVREITDLSGEVRSRMKKLFPDVQIFARTRWELNSGIFIVNKILEDRKNVRPHDSMGKFPFARAMAHVERGDLKIPYGIVKQYIDAQKEYNKRRSKLLHKSNVNRILAEEGSFATNDVERIRREAAKPDGVVLFKAGRQVQIDNDKPDQADVFLLQLAQTEIEDQGPPKEFLGTETKVLSGKAIGLRQLGGQKMLRPFYAALRSARRDAFAIILEEMQQYWTSEKLIKITDDPDAGNVVLNQRTADPRTGSISIRNNLRLGKYDIKVDEAPETPNQRAETFQQLVQLGEVALKAGEPFPIEMVIKSSDLPNKREWLEAIAIRRQQQQQLMMAQLQAQAAGAGPGNGQNVSPT